MTLNEFRISKGLTTEQMAEIIGKSAGSLRYYERGQRVIPEEVFEKLSEKYGISIDELKNQIDQPVVKECPDIIPTGQIREPHKLPALFIQSTDGFGITPEKVYEKVLNAAPMATEIYIKPEENRAYWVGEGMMGNMKLWPNKGASL